ncbi:MAG: YceI family protein [Cyclobacteriaceae bacterium]
MPTRVLLFFFLLFVYLPAISQKYSLEKSLVSFFSEAAIENIKAQNAKTSSLLNATTGEVVFSIPIKDFKFDKSLMQDHFNEKYMESDKYPKAIFQGKFLNLKLDETGEQRVTALGKLTMHGVTREIEVTGTVQIKSNQILARADFSIRLKDFKIKIPQLLWNNIAEEVKITTEFTYKPI